MDESLPASIAFERAGENATLEASLDGGAGACLLAQPRFAEVVCEALLHGAGRIDELHAFVVVPNHVHALTTFRIGFRLCDVVRGWKSYSARRINAILGRNGALWQRDYYDRYVRDERHFERARAYIENNPVAAGLVARAEGWRFSSLGWSVGVHADVSCPCPLIVGVDADAPIRAGRRGLRRR